MSKKEFYELMNRLTIAKRNIESAPEDHSIGFLRGFTLAGRMVWKSRDNFLHKQRNIKDQPCTGEKI